MALARSALAAVVVVRAAWTYFMTMTKSVSSTGKTGVETTPTWLRCLTKATSTPSSMEDGVLRPVPWDMSLSMSWRRRNNCAPQAAPTPYLGVEERRVQSVEYEWQYFAGKIGCILNCRKQTQKHQKQCKTLKSSVILHSIHPHPKYIGRYQFSSNSKDLPTKPHGVFWKTTSLMRTRAVSYRRGASYHLSMLETHKIP